MNELTAQKLGSALNGLVAQVAGAILKMDVTPYEWEIDKEAWLEVSGSNLLVPYGFLLNASHVIPQINLACEKMFLNIKILPKVGPIKFEVFNEFKGVFTQSEKAYLIFHPGNPDFPEPRVYSEEPSIDAEADIPVSCTPYIKEYTTGDAAQALLDGLYHLNLP